MYQLKITIRDSKPPIWRRVLVPEQIPFSELHAVIQLAFGWNDGKRRLSTVWQILKFLRG